MLTLNIDMEFSNFTFSVLVTKKVLRDLSLASPTLFEEDMGAKLGTEVTNYLSIIVEIVLL